MKLNAIKQYIPYLMILTLAFLILASTLFPGCSKTSPDDDADQMARTNTSDSGSKEIVYDQIQDRILDSIRENYSGEGIEIAKIELSSGSQDHSRITLKYPGYSKDQTALAGLSILKDNFPKLKHYTATAEGTTYAAEPDELEYILNKGYDFNSSPEDVAYYMTIINGGVPAEGKTLVEAQSS